MWSYPPLNGKSALVKTRRNLKILPFPVYYLYSGCIKMFCFQLSSVCIFTQGKKGRWNSPDKIPNTSTEWHGKWIVHHHQSISGDRHNILYPNLIIIINWKWPDNFSHSSKRKLETALLWLISRLRLNIGDKFAGIPCDKVIKMAPPSETRRTFIRNFRHFHVTFHVNKNREIDIIFRSKISEIWLETVTNLISYF